MTISTYDTELDARGLHCPLPLLRLKKTLSTMSSGQIVQVLATDPASVIDFGVYLEQAGHELISRCELADTFFFVIRKR